MNWKIVLLAGLLAQLTIGFSFDLPSPKNTDFCELCTDVSHGIYEFIEQNLAKDDVLERLTESLCGQESDNRYHQECTEFVQQFGGQMYDAISSKNTIDLDELCFNLGVCEKPQITSESYQVLTPSASGNMAIFQITQSNINDDQKLFLYKVNMDENFLDIDPSKLLLSVQMQDVEGCTTNFKVSNDFQDFSNSQDCVDECFVQIFPLPSRGWFYIQVAVQTMEHDGGSFSLLALQMVSERTDIFWPATSEQRHIHIPMGIFSVLTFVLCFVCCCCCRRVRRRGTQSCKYRSAPCSAKKEENGQLLANDASIQLDEVTVPADLPATFVPYDVQLPEGQPPQFFPVVYYYMPHAPYGVNQNNGNVNINMGQGI